MIADEKTIKHYLALLMLYFDMEYFGEPWATEDWKREQVERLVSFLERKDLLREIK